MKPFIKEYTNDELLQEDVKTLRSRGIKHKDIYVLSHDDDRTNRIVNNAGANTIGLKEMDFSEAVGTLFSTKGDELRTKLTEMGFSAGEAQQFEADMDEGKVLLMVTVEHAGNYLL